MLATLAQLKAKLGIATADTTLDDALTAILEEVSSAMCGPSGAGRALERASRTFYAAPEPAQHSLYLPVFPIVSITEVVEALDGAFDDETDLTEDTDFWVDEARGILHRVGCWLAGRPGEPSVRVVYTAGYPDIAAWSETAAYLKGAQVEDEGVVYDCIVAVTAPAEGEENTAPASDTTHWSEATDQTLVPADLRLACLSEAAHRYGNRLAPGVQSAGAGGGNVSMQEPGALLPATVEVCRRYRRLTA